MATQDNPTSVGSSPRNLKSPLIYEFAGYQLYTRNRLLLREGRPVTVPPKAFDTLVILLENAGSLVPKDQLLKRVWPDTNVEEGSLSQSIFTLRKILGESASEHRFILTSVGKGYVFIAPVTVREESPEAAPQAGLPSRSRSKLLRSRGFIAASLAAATIGGAFALRAWLTGDAEEVPYPPLPSPFTTFIGGEYEPAFSPDGAQLAFVWNGEREDNFDIYVSPVSALAPRRLTSDRLGEASPTWSPDGRQIAFIRCSLNPDEAGVFLVPSDAGPEMRLSDFTPLAHVSDRHLHWSPEGKYLAVSDKETPASVFSIYLLDSETGERQRLTSPPPTSLGDTGPVFSPNGRWIAFRRAQSAAVNDIYIVDVNGGEPRRVTHDNRFIAGHDWTEDGRELIFSSNRGGPQNLWRIAVKGGAPQGALPYGQDSYFLAVSRTGRLLAYSRLATDSDIWRLEIHPGVSSDAAAEKLISSTRKDASPQYSPDGRLIAFRSDRSGHDEIWICAEGERVARQLTAFEGPLTGSPRWSPDGKWIAFDSRPEGNSDIYVIPVVDGAPRRVTSSPADDVVPSFSQDGRWIYFGSNRGGSWQVWKIPSREDASETDAVQVTRNGGFTGFESPDGKYFYYAKGKDVDGLWRVPVQGGDERPIIDGFKAGQWGQWGITSEGIFYLETESADSDGKLCLFRFQTERVATLLKFGRRLPFGDAGFAVSADGRRILFSSLDRDASDIMLVRNFR